MTTGAPTGVRLRWAELLPFEEGEDLLRREPLFTEEVRVPLLLDLEAGGSALAGALLRADDPGACRQTAAEWLRPDVLREHSFPAAGPPSPCACPCPRTRTGHPTNWK